MYFLVPQGIGDSVWALHKVQSVARKIGEPVEILLNCHEENELEARALEVVRRFPFVKSARMAKCNIITGPPTPEGYYRYIPDGPVDPAASTVPKGTFALMPNAALERGIRLENWLPEYDIDWTVPGQFKFTEEENRYAEELSRKLNPFVVFYLGPLEGNTSSGHNRGLLWTPDDWANLGRFVQNNGVNVVVVGAAWDRPYWEIAIRRKTEGWHDFIGRWEIGQTFAVIQWANAVISYQSGIGIMSTYFGIPTVMWWRPKGNSICASQYLSFEEEMSTAWVPPAELKNGLYMPLIYGRESCEQIQDEMITRGWL